MMTTEDEVRELFWETFPNLPHERIRDYSGNGLMYPTDTRCAFVDFVDMLQKNGEITQELAEEVTL